MGTLQQRNHAERHRTGRIGWLRAAVLGANDGIISTASLVAGVAAANASHASIVTTAVAGLVAGAMSMAAGEYVSVHSQADTENADLDRERRELEEAPDLEHRELAAIYVRRGLEPRLADEVATQLMRRDALGAHARDELGISEAGQARPLQAALASAASFAAGGIIPVLLVLLVSEEVLLPWTIGGAVLSLAVLGIVAARIGGASVWRSCARVVFWGTFAMALTAAIGTLFGAAS
ncbi:VIT family protein [Kerstersia similis]|uniref:VIT1/CCC1 transporter family protein n=1 Tax=Kerstersia similis TaxID=206505 RepID=UPI0039EE19F7